MKGNAYNRKTLKIRDQVKHIINDDTNCICTLTTGLNIKHCHPGRARFGQVNPKAYLPQWAGKRILQFLLSWKKKKHANLGHVGTFTFCFWHQFKYVFLIREKLIFSTKFRMCQNYFFGFIDLWPKCTFELS